MRLRLPWHLKAEEKFENGAKRMNPLRAVFLTVEKSGLFGRRLSNTGARAMLSMRFPQTVTEKNIGASKVKTIYSRG